MFNMIIWLYVDYFINMIIDKYYLYNYIYISYSLYGIVFIYIYISIVIMCLMNF